MTEMGKEFAYIADSISRIYGNNSNKMTEGYSIIIDENHPCHGECYGKDNRKELAELVKMGYLREFEGTPRINNRKRNWRYQFMVRPTYFGLTKKGWAVAQKYIDALNKF